MGGAPIGLYLHVPFCAGKCPYCDFYSLCPQPGQTDQYIGAAAGRLQPLSYVFDTVYFGGGTPGLLGADGLARILGSLSGKLTPDCEITVELNPADTGRAFFTTLRAAGFNRISMGLQSADSGELSALGRRHSAGQAQRAVEDAQAAGFKNLSLDLMLGVPGASPEKLLQSVAFCTGLGIPHLSCYMLKIEPGTPYAAKKPILPDDDAVCDAYLTLVALLKEQGLLQYEISNFARPGFESRHNLKYWRGEQYLGIGPAAHSFVGGRRFYFPRSLEAFLAGAQPVDDGPGGGFTEYAMLRLRLTEGLRAVQCAARFGPDAFPPLLLRAKKLPPPLVNTSEDGISFTPQGFLVSNALIGALLQD